MFPEQLQNEQNMRKYTQDLLDSSDALEERINNLETDEAGLGASVFVPVNAANNGNFDDYGWRVRTNTTEWASMQWIVPATFNSFTTLAIHYIPQATNTATFYTYSDYSADGEAWNTHSESNLTHSVAETLDQRNSVDVSDLVDDLEPGDILNIRLHGSGAGSINNFGVIGLEIVWS